VPQNQWSYGGETDIAALATSLLYAIARNHPFVQGNKRTGFMAALSFMELNGWRAPMVIDSGELGELVVAGLRGEVEERAVAAILKATAVPLAPT